MPRRTDLKSICVIGSGPIVIGQACEFDYSGCQALKVLREDGFRTIVINSNPATIMTDPGFADRTYIEPLDLEGVTDVLRRERPDQTIAIFVMIPLVAVIRTGIVISEKYVPAAGVAVVVQMILVVPLHVHPRPEIGAFRTIPVGRVSVTVVVHDT